MVLINRRSVNKNDYVVHQDCYIIVIIETLMSEEEARYEQKSRISVAKGLEFNTSNALLVIIVVVWVCNIMVPPTSGHLSERPWNNSSKLTYL